MKYFSKVIIFIPIIIFSCNVIDADMNKNSKFDWQGHRGCRGLLPENSIPAFIKAIDLNVATLEMDVAVSKDNKIIVSHEPWMSSDICLTPLGKSISKEEEKSIKIYEIDYSLIAAFDCGSLGNKRFPKQQKLPVSKPSLKDVFLACEKHINKNNLNKVRYNIEIKSKPEWDSIFSPTPDIFSKLLVEELKVSGISMDRFCLQSFDVRVLKYLHANYPEITIAYLIEEPYEDILSLLEDNLGFTPPIFSPYYKLLSQQKVKTAQQVGMKVIPWTVNTKKEMEELRNWGVDGIITDYPNIAPR